MYCRTFPAHGSARANRHNTGKKCRNARFSGHLAVFQGGGFHDIRHRLRTRFRHNILKEQTDGQPAQNRGDQDTPPGKILSKADDLLCRKPHIEPLDKSNRFTQGNSPRSSRAADKKRQRRHDKLIVSKETSQQNQAISRLPAHYIGSRAGD